MLSLAPAPGWEPPGGGGAVGCQQLCVAQPAVIEGLNADDALQQVMAMALQVVEQRLAHVALTGSVAEQQHSVGGDLNQAYRWREDWRSCGSCGAHGSTLAEPG